MSTSRPNTHSFRLDQKVIDSQNDEPFACKISCCALVGHWGCPKEIQLNSDFRPLSQNSYEGYETGHTGVSLTLHLPVSVLCRREIPQIVA